MSKFLNLCEKVERFLKEQGEMPPVDPNAQPLPGQPVDPSQSTLDPETQSVVRDVNNEKIEEMIEIIVNFYQKGRALSADAINDINRLPAKINSENSEHTVNELINIFNKSDLPEDTTGLES